MVPCADCHASLPKLLRAGPKSPAMNHIFRWEYARHPDGILLKKVYIKRAKDTRMKLTLASCTPAPWEILQHCAHAYIIIQLADC